MAQMHGAVTAAKSTLPDGAYRARITECIEKPSDTKQGAYILSVRFTVQEGDYRGMNFYDSFCTYDPANSDYYRISMQRLGDLAIACGYEKGKQITNTDEFMNREVAVTKKTSPSKDGKEAILNYQVINQILIGGAIHSYVKVELVTGRYNQIRFQFASRHHPLMNDYKYGYSLSRGEEIGLWCYEVIFTHPTLKKEMKFTLYPQKGIWDKLERGEK